MVCADALSFYAPKKDVIRSAQASDGTRVEMIREATYQTALRATRKAIRDDRTEPAEKPLDRSERKG